MYASGVSAQPCVRAFLLDMQRQLARTHNVIMDGRDIGTVVLPHADVKIFLTADAEVRAKRRYDELQQKGDKTPYAQILAETKQRDKQDSERAAAPLRQAADAVAARYLRRYGRAVGQCHFGISSGGSSGELLVPSVLVAVRASGCFSGTRSFM